MTITRQPPASAGTHRAPAGAMLAAVAVAALLALLAVLRPPAPIELAPAALDALAAQEAAI